MKKTSGKGPKRKDVKKIKITFVDPKTKTRKGLFGEGCYLSECKDECCSWGCDVDYGTIKTIERHKDLVEPLVEAQIEDCFKTELKIDDDYIGGAFRETMVRKEDNRCAFHLKGKKGCSLFYLWATRKLPKKIVPTICRTYPITWHRGKLFVDGMKKSCKAREKTPKGMTVPSLWDTQKKEIKALFDIQEKKSASKKKAEEAAPKAKKAAPAAKKTAAKAKQK